MFNAFLKDPISTGSVASSSETLATKIVSLSQIYQGACVVEQGPGNGVITKHIIKKTSQENISLFETNQSYISLLIKNYPNTKIFSDDASKINSYISSGTIKKPDRIISSIPLTLLKQEQLDKLIKENYDSLNDSGLYIQFLYTFNPNLFSKNHFKESIRQTFSDVKTSIVYKNLPPATIFVARK